MSNSFKEFCSKGKVRDEAIAGGRSGGDQRNAAGKEVLASINCSSLPRDRENSSAGNWEQSVGFCQVPSIIPSSQV